MWYYESVSFQWQCNAWAADSHRFAAWRVIWYNYALYHYAKEMYHYAAERLFL